MIKYDSPADEATAAKLGLAVPKPAALPKGRTTNVVGYFNANPWPVHVAISSLNIAIHMPNRGSFVVDNQGNKVNDPILESYVGPGQLSREVSKDPVPLRLFARPNMEGPGQHSVHQASEFVQTPDGVRPVEIVRKEATGLPANHATCVGMSMEQARRLRLVRPTVEPRVNSPKDTDGQPHQASEVPTLDEATPRDMTPREYARWLAEHDGRLGAASTPPPEGQPADDLDRPQDQVSVPSTAVPETPEQEELQRSLVEASGDRTVLEDAVAGAVRVAMPIASDEEEPPAEDTPQDPTAGLPKPKLAPDAPNSVPPALRKYTCLVDGRGFDYRSQLETYARQKYPDRVDEIMARYPRHKKQ